tara:strand:+ start:163 stop:2973 length:2811 start_codon:yes stop_codon:yes gene_type:complete
MGWFKTKKKHYADTQTIRVIEDSMIPDMMLSVAVDVQITEQPVDVLLKEHYMKSSFRKFDSAYAWAKRDNEETGLPNYLYKTPDVDIWENTDGYELAIAQLKSDVGQTAVVDYMKFRPINNIFMGWKYLTESYGYNYKTNELESLAEPYDYVVVTLTAADDPEDPPIRTEVITVMWTRYYLDHMVGVYETGPNNSEDGINYVQPESGSMEAWGVPSNYGYTPTRGNYSQFNFTNPMQLTSQAEIEEIRVGVNETEGVEIWVTWENPKIPPPPQTIEDIRNGLPPIKYDYVRPDLLGPGTDAIENRNLRLEFFYDLSAAPWTEENPEPFEQAYEQEYYQAQYTDDNGDHGYWIYNPSRGSNAALNAVFAPPDYVNPGDYFPIVVFRSNAINDTNGDRTRKPYDGPDENGNITYKRWEDRDGNYAGDAYMQMRTELWDCSTALCDQFGFDFEEMGRQIHAGEYYIPEDDRDNSGDWMERPEPGSDGQNQGDGFYDDRAEDIQQAVMILGVPITTNHQLDVKYLYKWFDDIRKQLPVNAGYFDPINPFTGGSFTSLFPQSTTLSGGDGDSFVIAFSDADFELRISFDDISSRIQSGVLIAPPQAEGESASDFADRQDPTYTNTFMNVDTAGVAYPSGEVPEGVSTRIARVIRKKIPNIDQYIELIIINPRFIYPIEEGIQAPFGDGNDNRLLVPINMEIVRGFKPADKEVLYSRSLHMVFNSHTIEKVKWYQQDWFKVVMVIVAVVIAIYFPWLGPTVLGTTAFAAASVTQIFVLAVIQAALTTYGVNLIITYAVEALGLELAFLIAVAVAIYTGYIEFDAAATLAQNADMFLKAVTMLTEAWKLKSAEEMAELLEDIAKQTEINDALTEEMQRVEEELSPAIDLDLYANIRRTPFLVPNELPDDYFKRTLETNPGVESLKLVQNFLDTSLKLPDIGEV